MQGKPIILATRNRGKIREFKELLSDFDTEVKSLLDFGPIPDIIEDGDTFEENAYKKAHEAARMLGLPALADDSGLVVEALNGEPGVRSARYAGLQASDLENNLKLLEAMKGQKNRNAAFECVIAVAVPRGPALIYEGRCEGQITTELSGDHGFGYDPLLYYPPLKKTLANLSLTEKNSISHRGRAMAEVKAEFNKILIWLEQRLSEEPL